MDLARQCQVSKERVGGVTCESWMVAFRVGTARFAFAAELKEESSGLGAPAAAALKPATYQYHRPGPTLTPKASASDIQLVFVPDKAFV